MLAFTPGAANDGDTGAFTVNGSTVRGQNLQLDGVNVTDPVVGTQNVSFSFDNLEEIQVQTGGHAAEYGQVSGAVVNAITKSGGNELSGGANVYFGNSGLTSTNGQDITERFENLTPNELDQRLDTHVQVGGPVARDKIWFFGSYGYRDQDTRVVGFEELSNQNENFGYGKVTWQATPANKLVGSVNYSSLTRNNRGANSTTPPEVTRTQEGNDVTANVELTSMLSPSTYVQVRGARVDSFFDLLPKNDLPGRFNLSTGQSSVSNGIADRTERDRLQVNGALSHYRDDLAGSHDFKFGFEYEDAENLRDFSANQGLYYDDTGTTVATPTYVYEIPQSVTERELSRLSLYAQDSWTIDDRLTLNLGVRFDANSSGFPEQVAPDGTVIPAIEDVTSFSNVSPRLGAAFDLGGDGKSVLRASYARVVDANITQYISGVNPLAISGRAFIICGGPADDGSLCGPGATRSRVPISEFGASNTEIDPEFSSPLLDEYTVGIEQELFTNLSFGVSYIEKQEHNLPEDIEVARSFHTRLVVDPGDTLLDEAGDVVEEIPGGATFEVSDPDLSTPTRLLITNPDGAEREYRALQLTVNKPMSDRWQLFGSLVLSRSAGLVGTSFGNSSSISSLFDRPDSLVTRSATSTSTGRCSSSCSAPTRRRTTCS